MRRVSFLPFCGFGGGEGGALLFRQWAFFLGMSSPHLRAPACLRRCPCLAGSQLSASLRKSMGVAASVHVRRAHVLPRSCVAGIKVKIRIEMFFCFLAIGVLRCASISIFCF